MLLNVWVCERILVVTVRGVDESTAYSVCVSLDVCVCVSLDVCVCVCHWMCVCSFHLD